MVSSSCPLLCRLLVAASVFCTSDANTVTITTEAARLDVDGNHIDAHDGKIVVVKGTYYLVSTVVPGHSFALHR